MKNIAKLATTLIALNFAGFVYIGCGGGDDNTTPDQTDGGSDSANDVTTTSDSGSDSSANDSGVDSGPFIPQTLSVSIDKVPESTGAENTYCVTKKLGNTGVVHAGTLHTTITGGSSTELIVYKSDDTTESPTPTACQPFKSMAQADGGTALTVVQSTDETLTFPSGDAFTLGDHQMIRLELHAIDTDGTGFGATASFTTTPDADFKNEVGMIVGGTIDINLPPGTGAVSENVPVPAAMGSGDLLYMSGHQHLYGTGVTVAYGAGPTPTTQIYDNTGEWSTPTLTAVAAGETLSTSDVFALACNWNNASGTNVTFGEGAHDEQCYFRAHYAPSGGTQVCFHTNQGGGSGTDVCCPGSALCSTTFP